ncbi:sugar ABC transporter permease [Cryobacterium sp. TmT2-59]|uniref:Sugar ABC transporter permease n=1 Tax=Cryobacterium shii TaxID=1259235 RepID=A0AAQ2HG88_9MICO|nr:MULTISPECIES: sugar ABC transporter permease [Cryobacterium]TFC50490.1 sugar ABC transporter permease [Cryobacterium shii]TFC82123.1 sugar ABC transporter permease [Cryobacterium sp. TmT2-59]
MTSYSLPTRRRFALGERATRTLFIVPALAIFTIVMLVPVAMNAGYAFTDWNGFTQDFGWVGLANFAHIGADVATRTAFVNTLVFTAINAPLQILIGLILALSLRSTSRFIVGVRLIVVMPIAVSGVVLGFIGTIIFDPRTGILAALAESTGLEFIGANWLGDPKLAMAAVIAMNLWQWSGFTMLIFLAGLTSIPEELYEAAQLDGASRWQQFSQITWPLLSPAATINIVLTLIGGLKIFDVVYVLTGGGPGDATRTVVMRVVTQGATSNYGYSASISVTLTILTMIVALVALAVLRRREARNS